MHNYHVPGYKMTLFGVDVLPIPNKTRRVLEWHYSIFVKGHTWHYISDSLECAIVHIIAIKNNREDMAKAACLLLDVNISLTGACG